jgi:predicted TIM-barrel fold metal-dependent hydrolase
MTRVDSHLHVWRAAGGETAGISTIVPPQADVPIDAACEALAANAIDRAVLVQPAFRGEDNSYVAECARAEPARFAAVCVVDPRLPGSEVRLQHWVEEGCRGLRLRPRLPDEEKVFGDPSTYPLWEAAGRLGVVVSVLCGPSHCAMIAAMAERFSDVSIVIDHMGHPDPAAGASDASFAALLALARFPRVSIKTSGFYHFSREPHPFADCWEFVRAAYEHFGPQRLLWGSDFPHVTQTCGYERSLRLPEDAIPDWSAADAEQVMGGTALALYWPEA